MASKSNKVKSAFRLYVKWGYIGQAYWASIAAILVGVGFIILWILSSWEILALLVGLLLIAFGIATGILLFRRMKKLKFKEN
ncbi:hypothetical protein KAR91_62940 [Candidatus Pacearchaeota archaeon]|nr:hypothetical protein [Candidatus Pacearchaeota archaeon]